MSIMLQQPAALSDSRSGAHKSAQTKKRNILDLPQQLLDIIFGYVYARPIEAKLIRTRPQRTHHSWSSRADPEIEQLIPDTKLKVDEWFISKKWFITAAKVYLEGQVVSVKTVGYGKSCCRVLEALSTSLYTDSINSHYFKSERYPKMLSLHLQISPYFDWKEEAHTEDIVALSDDQIKDMEVFKDLMAVSGLRKLKVSGDHAHRRETPEEMAVIEVNLKRIEELAWPIVSRIKDATEYELDKDGLPTLGYYREKVESLYDGSEVCLGTPRTVSDVAMDLWQADFVELKARRVEEGNEIGALMRQLADLAWF